MSQLLIELAYLYETQILPNRHDCWKKLAPTHAFVFKTVQVFFVSNFCEDEYNLQACLYITTDRQCLTYLSLKVFQQNA